MRSVLVAKNVQKYVYPGGLIFINDNNKAEIINISEFGWNGCWKCEHCIAVCHVGAISILEHYPEITYMRGTQRTVEKSRIHTINFKEE